MRTSTMLLLALVAVRPIPGAAQELRLEVRGGRVTDERGESHPGATLAPALVWSGASTALAVMGEAVFPAAGGMWSTAGLSLRARSASRGPALALSVDGSAQGSTSGYRAFAASAAPRLAYVGSGWAVEAGPHLGLARRRDAGAGAGPAGWPLLGAAADRADKPHAVVGLGAELRGASGPVGWHGAVRSSRSGAARWHDLEAGVALETGRLTVGVEGGLRGGGVAERWAGARTSFQLTPRLALLARGGRYAADPLGGAAGGTRVEVGVRLRMDRSPAAVTPPPTVPPPLRSGGARIVLRAEPGARVELVADWTGWKPVVVRESDPGEYEVVVRLPAGTHRFAFRVDGAWRIPEGHATEPDGYGGRHAVVRVAGR